MIKKNTEFQNCNDNEARKRGLSILETWIKELESFDEKAGNQIERNHKPRGE